MDIKQLKRFLELCQSKSFTQTAQQLYLSQQALSSSMAALEDELHTTLFQRTPKGILLTEEGAFLQQLCTPVVDSFDEMTQQLHQRFQYKRRILRLALAPLVLQSSAPDLLLRFRMEYPTFELKAVECPDTVCVEHVASGAVDLAFCPRPEAFPASMTYLPLGQQRIYAVLPRDHPLANRKSLCVAQLQQEQLISLNKYYHIHQTVINSCRSCGFLPRFVVETGEIGVLLGMVGLNPCIFLCMEQVTRDMDKGRCVKIPMADPQLVWNYGLLYQNGRKPDPAAQHFIAFSKSALTGT